MNEGQKYFILISLVFSHKCYKDKIGYLKIMFKMDIAFMASNCYWEIRLYKDKGGYTN